MPKINSITYTLDGGKQVYRPGDTVSGSWTIDLGESFTVRGIRLALEGVTYTRWRHIDVKKDDKISKENIITQWRTVFGKKLGEDGLNPTISDGVHKYRFNFKLPEDGLPSSYEGKYGAVRYWLRLQIDRPLLRFNVDRYKVITVLDNIDVNTPELSKFVGRRTVKKISVALGLGDQGSVTLHGQTDRGAYCPGEKIAISLIANNESDKDLGVIKASFMQKTKFVASDEEKTTEQVLRTVTGSSLLKKTKKNWSNQLLQIDAVPPSTRARTCHIITVSYFLKVYVDVPLLQGGDIIMYIPVTVGTIPQGYNRTAALNVASNFNEVDLSSVITYTECNRGFEIFSKSGSGFPRLDYNPWCAYVPNFQFKKIQRPTVVDKTQGATASPKPVPSTATSPRPSKPSDLPTPRPSTSLQTSQAGPLPPKSGLPPPSVVVPASMPTGAYAYPEPTAPPLELSPPSYEEAMAGLVGIVPEQPKEEVVPDSAQSSDDEEKASPKTTIVILRLSDSFIVWLRDKLKDTKEMLRKFGGEVIALAPQVIVNNGTWPSRISVVVLLFDTKEGGKQWFEEFDTQCKASNIDILDSVLGATKEEFKNEKSTFVLNLLTIISADYKSQEGKRYVTLARKQLTPLRQESGGVMLTATRLLTHLQGMWPDTKLFITLVQWDSIVQYHEHRKKLQNDKYKEVTELRKKFFNIDTQVFFQTEDLNFLEDVLPDSDSQQESER